MAPRCCGSTCLGPQVAAAARGVALRHLRDANDIADARQRITLLREGLRFSNEPWQLHVALGDALQQVGDFAAATLAYQLGMNAARDLAPGQPAPERAATRDLVQKASGTRRLAGDRSIRIPQTRDGSPGGLSMASIRDVEVNDVPSPINFPHDSDVPTRDGYEAIRELFDLLRERGSPAVTLVGHCDQTGDHAYNDALSLRRARSVANILAQMGYAGPIQVEGRGKREPFRMPQVAGVTYTPDQLKELDRRVELRR